MVIFCGQIYIILKKLSIHFNFFDNFLIKTTVLDNFNRFSNKSKFKLDKSQIEKGENFLNKIGINKKDKIVLLCIRDGKYLKKIFQKITIIMIIEIVIQKILNLQ